MRDVKPVLSRSLCPRCKTNLTSVVLRDTVSCRDCFTSLTASRIKSAIRTKCNFAKGANVLLAISGGASSTCLAHVMSVACDPRSDKPMLFGFEMIHIDESAIYVGTPEEAEEFNRAVDAIVAPMPHKMMRVPLEEVMRIGTPEEAPARGTDVMGSVAAATSVSESSSPSPARVALQSLFRSLKDPSDQMDLRDLLRMRLLAHIARREGFAQVVLGDNAARTAETAFGDTTKGRGSTVPLSVLSVESRMAVAFQYPMRDISSTAVALYNHYKALTPVFRPTFQTLKKAAQPGSGGINKLAHDFLHMLDSKFSSSVANIVATVGKLRVAPELTQKPNETILRGTHCSLCHRHLVRKESEESDANRLAGSGVPRHLLPANAALLATIPSCYGCQSLMRELSDATLLPPYVRAGCHADHRDSAGASTYPAATNRLIRSEVHAARNAELLRAKQAKRQVDSKERQANEHEAEESATQPAALDQPDSSSSPASSASPSSSPLPDSSSASSPLVLQSRAAMKASIADCLLTEQ